MIHVVYLIPINFKVSVILLSQKLAYLQQRLRPTLSIRGLTISKSFNSAILSLRYDLRCISSSRTSSINFRFLFLKEVLREKKLRFRWYKALKRLGF